MGRERNGAPLGAPSLFEAAAEAAAFVNPGLARSQALADLLGAPKVAVPPVDGLFGADPAEAGADG